MPGLGDDHDDSHIGRVLDGRYRIAAPIASGGMGAVYRGERIGIGKRVAIKLLHRSAALHPEHRKRFEREAVAMSRVSHPNLVSVIDHGIDHGIPYLVMEYHPGQTLREALASGPLPAARAVAIARHVVAGMRGFHEAGVIHRDLKPENVLLLEDVEHDFAKVLDFGVAKLLDPDGKNDVTRAGHVVGTPAYLSPEQARLQPLDARADIYTFGVMLFEMVTGRRPFEAEDPLVFLRLHAEQQAPAPRSLGARISVELEDLILIALAKDPAIRYQSAADLATALANVPEASGESARRPDSDPAAVTAVLDSGELSGADPADNGRARTTRPASVRRPSTSDDGATRTRWGPGRAVALLLAGIGALVALAIYAPAILDRIRARPARVVAPDAVPIVVPDAIPDAVPTAVPDAVPDALPIAVPIDALATDVTVTAPVIDAAIVIETDATPAVDTSEPDATPAPPPPTTTTDAIEADGSAVPPP